LTPENAKKRGVPRGALPLLNETNPSDVPVIEVAVSALIAVRKAAAAVPYPVIVVGVTW
jgi:hypothetical protein